MKKKRFIQLMLASSLCIGTTTSWSNSNTLLRSGVDLKAMDRSVDPKQDFYQFVNGTWLKTAKIPEDEARSGAFGEVADKTTEQIRIIVEDLLKQQHTVGSEEQKISDLYRSYINTAQIEQLGIDALAKDLERIDAIKNKKDLAKFFAYANQVGINLPFSMRIHQDRKASTDVILFLGQGSLGMSERDFYMGEAQRFQDIRHEYLLYIANTLNYAGIENPIEHAKTIMALERALAKISWTPTQFRDDKVGTYLFGTQQIKTFMPSFDWLTYFSEVGLKGAGKQIGVSQVNYLRDLDALWKVIPVETWQVYLKFNLINSYADTLSQTFKAHQFQFYNQTLAGVQKAPTREREALLLTNQLLGSSIGKRYVAKHFDDRSLPAMHEMVENIRKAFHLKLDEATWMGNDTKKEVRHKLDSIRVKIGHPKVWRDYTNLEIKHDDLVGNIQRARMFNFQRELEKVGKAVDPEAWMMSPQTVNAYYNGQMNEIVLSAAIWQAPFYDAKFDPAVNYGGIGAVIAHEFSHGFDDRGSRLDAKGKGQEWWNERDRKRFNERTKALVEQYKQYEALPGHKANSVLNSSENISDNLGLGIAHTAYRLSLKGQEAPVLDGFTGDQRFYIGWAQVWRTKSTPQSVLNNINLAVHAPGHIRANGTVRNQQGFYEAFAVKEGDKMYIEPEKRISIW